MDQPELRINISYIPRTIPYLSSFALSLVDWTDGCRFRLVSNDYSPEEERVLRQVAKLEDQLEFLSSESRRVLSYGKALSLLQRREEGPYFAFLDSDVFATGEFLSDFLVDLEAANTVFSDPTTLRSEKDSEMASWQMWDSGYCSTHFAFYNNQVLSELIAELGVDFSSYYGREVPRKIQM